jgi:hypothetical protein
MAKKAPKKPNADDLRTIAAVEARLKKLRGQELTRQQLRDLDWLENLDRRRHIETWQMAVPKGEYCQLASRQHKLVDDAADNYNLPIGESTINLRDALTALHDLVAANSHRISRGDLDGDRFELEEEKLRQQILGLEFDNAKKQIELQYTRGDAIPKASVRDALVALSAQLRTLGQTLARIDPAARDQLNDFLDSLAGEIEGGNLAF